MLANTKGQTKLGDTHTERLTLALTPLTPRSERAEEKAPSTVVRTDLTSDSTVEALMLVTEDWDMSTMQPDSRSAETHHGRLELLDRGKCAGGAGRGGDRRDSSGGRGGSGALGRSGEHGAHEGQSKQERGETHGN
jgi:hypothetical protein